MLYRLDDPGFLVLVVERHRRAHARGVADRADLLCTGKRDDPDICDILAVQVRAKGPGQQHFIEGRALKEIDQQVDPGRQGSLGQLDRAHVGLLDVERVFGAIEQYILPALAFLDEAVRGGLGLEQAALVDQAGAGQFDHHFKNARSADPDHALFGDIGIGVRQPFVAADHLEAGLESLAVDPHAFDCARCGAHPGADFRAFEGRAGG